MINAKPKLSHVSVPADPMHSTLHSVTAKIDYSIAFCSLLSCATIVLTMSTHITTMGKSGRDRFCGVVV
jgi:hypothetical protein